MLFRSPDTWWQTETGGIMIANVPAFEIRPGSMGKPLPGVEAALVARQPDGGVRVIDAAGDRGTFRSEIYPEYKAHREAPPDDFRPQVQRCVEICRLLGVPVVAVPRVEADDAIATLVRRARRASATQPIRILSRDKDLGQLLDDHAVLVDGQTGQMIDAEALFESKGVKPSQVVDMLTLMGDPVDNVPGAKGIGPKTAASLSTRYGSLDALQIVRAHV